MKITTYTIAAPYWINGHQNQVGQSIADEINKRLMDQGITGEHELVERELADVDVELYGLAIEATEVEIDE